MYLSPDYIIVSYKNLRLTTVAVVFMHKCLQKGSSLHRVWFYIRTYLQLTRNPDDLERSTVAFFKAIP